ncbi:MAG: SUMF1/EgtB/PvdO family nonheme iron enzyme [Archangium sp.]|nr:SUMF1/EgtB/PvdO family nonheme iron enzyme [Archangium sp.]
MSVRVFLSHSSENDEVAARVCQALEAWGHRCWVAPRDVRPGQQYGAEIVEGLEASDVVLLLLTAAATRSKWVVRELEAADKRNKTIYVLPVEAVDPGPGLELFISSSQWFRFSGHLQNDLQAVAAAIGPRDGQATELVKITPETAPAPPAPSDISAARPGVASVTVTQRGPSRRPLIAFAALAVAIVALGVARIGGSTQAPVIMTEPRAPYDGGAFVVPLPARAPAELLDGGADDGIAEALKRLEVARRSPVARAPDRDSAPDEYPDLEAVVRDHKKELIPCLADAAKTMNVRGKVPIEFAIAENGELTRVQVDLTEQDSETEGLVSCLSLKLETWPFPPVSGGAVVRFSFNIGEETATAQSASQNPPSPCPGGMRAIPSGILQFGTPRDDPMMGFDEATIHSVDVPGFCIDINEHPNEKGVTPTNTVSFTDAMVLCESKGKRLCSEAEWEKACKGPAAMKWPFGNTFDGNACNTENDSGEARSLAPAGRFGKCRSGYGIADMSGNVAEWTSDRIIKGGSYTSGDYAVRCSARKNGASFNKSHEVGFRCCVQQR